MIDLTLNNGVVMPALGFGVFQSGPEETAMAVETALATGYRHVDTAAVYGNETQVGEGIRRSGVPREEVFVETKVWVSDYGYEPTLLGFEKSARKLGIDTIDLLILHQPAPERFEQTLDAYRALETLLADGHVRAIGVSNFLPKHLERLVSERDVIPAVNQVELHPYSLQSDVQAVDTGLGVVTQAWSPIGGITFYPGFNPDSDNILEDETLRAVADAHGKTVAQVILRWHLDQGRSAIPKSVTPSRIAENFDIFDFELTVAERARIDGLDRGMRRGPDPEDPETPQRYNFDEPIPD